MAGAAQVQLEGMKEFRKAVRGFETDTEWRPALRSAYGSMSTAAATAIQAAAGSTRLGSAGTADITGKATTTAATVVAFKRTPYGAGFNFGSSGRYPQFPAKKKPDHFIYSTLERIRDQLRAGVLEAIDSAFANAGL